MKFFYIFPTEENEFSGCTVSVGTSTMSSPGENSGLFEDEEEEVQSVYKGVDVETLSSEESLVTALPPRKDRVEEMSFFYISQTEEDECTGWLEDKEDEVQSGLNGDDGGALSSMETLEEALHRRSLSKFYYGQSKSFTNLTDAYYFSSIQNMAKPNNPYAKKT